MPDNFSFNTDNKVLLRLSDLKIALGLSRSSIYRLIKAGLLPQPVPLIPGGKSVAWVASEIQEWIEQRIAERDAEVQA
jgi:prophage regulatory protein